MTNLTPLLNASRLSEEAQEALAQKLNLKRGVLEAMLVAGEAVLRSLDPDTRPLVHFEIVREDLPELLGRAFEPLIRPLEDHASDMANVLFDIECEIADARSIGGTVKTYQIEKKEAA